MTIIGNNLIKAKAPVGYTFTLTAIGSGSLSKSPDQPVYSHGDEVVVTATPEPDWSFAGWSGSCTGMGECIVIVDGNESVTATFIEDL